MFKWFRKSTLDPLSVSMAGVKLGDRLLIVGCTDPQLVATLGLKPGLTGRTCAVDDVAARVEAAGRAALAEGALVETATTPLDALPYDANAFDVVVLRDAGRGRTPEIQTAIVAQAHRVLRAGGRCLVIDTTREAGALGGLMGGRTSAAPSAAADAVTGALRAGGFVAVRTLAEREGLVFAEGVKRNADTP